MLEVLANKVDHLTVAVCVLAFFRATDHHGLLPCADAFGGLNFARDDHDFEGEVRLSDHTYVATKVRTLRKISPRKQKT